MNKEFNNCVIASSANAWMDMNLTNVWVDKVLGAFSFRRRHLIWDSYECHTEGSVQVHYTLRRLTPQFFREDVRNISKRQMCAGTNLSRPMQLKCTING